MLIINTIDCNYHFIANSVLEILLSFIDRKKKGKQKLYRSLLVGLNVLFKHLNDLFLGHMNKINLYFIKS